MPFVTRAPTKGAPEKVPKTLDVSIPFTRSRGTFTVHVLEHAPARFRVHFKKKWKDPKWRKKRHKYETFRIRLPWMYFMIRLNRAGAITDTFLWVSPKQIESPKDTVFMAPLPNIYPSGHICNGTIKVTFADPPWRKAIEAFKAFWTTPFTEETWPEDYHLLPKCLTSQGDWSIEYGYLIWIFEYWQKHDKQSGHADCFPWQTFRVPATKKGHQRDREYVGEVKTLDAAMDYALMFPNWF